KIPMKVLESSYSDRVKSDVSEDLIQETYFDALAQVKLEAVVHPDIKSYEFNEDGSFSYVAEVEVKPQFELGAYKGVEIEHVSIDVSEEEITKSLELTRREMAPLQSITDRGVQKDDLIIIDFQGYEDGKELQYVSGKDSPVDVGSGRNGQEFEGMLLGLKLDEESRREVQFPADFASTMLAGKTIEFKITVKNIKERVLPAIDDDFAKDVSEDFATLAELTSSISEKIRKEKEKAMDGDITDKLMLKLVDSHTFEVPARLVAYEIDALAKDFETNLERQNLSLEAIGLSREKLAETYHEAAERRVKGDFILKKIAEVEAIKLANDDITQGYSRIAQQYGMKIDEVKEYFKGRNNLMPFMNELLNEKILAFLRNATTVKFVEAEAKEAGAES
ncbi:MAG: trigger factor, partial [Rectinemataceae bacterium]|nr:trigger factor [Rectinemataceae bacterium]